MTAEWVSAIGTMLQGIFAVVATIGGLLAFNNWRHEQIGTRKIEIAEEALALMYEARDVFRAIRSPFTSHLKTEVEDDEDAQKEGRECRRIAFGHAGRKDDPLNGKINAAVEKMEKITKSYLG
jgi:hypothetical protein